MNKHCESVLSEYLGWGGGGALYIKAQIKPQFTLGLAESRMCPFRFMSRLGCVHSGLRFSTGRTIETLPHSA